MNKQEYNGWTNYETWNVALWLDNERGTHDYWLDVVNTALHTCIESGVVIQVADMLKESHEESLPEVLDHFRDVPDGPWMLQGFAVDLLNAAMSEVNWYEIAEHLIADAKENAQAS